MRLALSFLLTLSMAQAPSPEPPQKQGTPVFPAGVDLVSIDVNVVDDNGRPAGDLSAADFEVKIGGKPRRVVSAEFLSRTRQLAEQAPVAPTHYSTNEGIVPGRLVLLAVDEGNIAAGGGRHAARAGEKLIDRLGTTDRVGFLSIPGPEPREEFTTDHARAREALKKVVGRARFQGKRLSLSESLSFVENEDPRRWQELVARLCPPGDRLCPDELESEARMVHSDYQMQSSRSIGMLRGAFEGLRPVEGPKVMVLITQGLGVPGTGTRAGVGNELQRLGEAARLARVAFFVVLIDAGSGVSAESDISAQRVLEDHDLHSRALDYLADGARGAVLRGAPENAFERIAREISGHYQIGFEPENKDRDGKSHAVSVKVKRKGLTVRVGRDVVFPKPGVVVDAKAAIAALVRSPLIATELPMRTASWSLKDVATGKIRLMVETDVAGQRASNDVSLGYLLIDAQGKTVTAGMQQPQQGDAASRAGFASFAVEPGLYTLRVGARDSRSRAGSVEHPVSAALHEAEGVEWSDLLVGAAPEEGQSFRPAPEATLSLAGGALGSHLELYAKSAASLDGLDVWIDVIRADTSALVKTVRAPIGLTPTEGRRVAQALIPGDRLAPGNYILRAVIRTGDKMLGDAARPFRVVAP